MIAEARFWEGENQGLPAERLCRARQIAARALSPTESADKPEDERIYPCGHKGCKVMRTKAEGGNVFHYCEKHWPEGKAQSDE